MPYKAIIFDRDATLNKTTQILRAGQQAGDPTDGYVLAPSELQLFDGVRAALTLLRQNGITPFVFTQQNCIGKGLVTLQEVADIHTHMNTLLTPAAKIEAFYIATSKDDLRGKPSPAMIVEIMRDHGFTKDDVLVVGDSLRDYQSAQAAGVDFVWVRDDLGRISDAEMQKTGCPIFDNVLLVAQEFLALHPPANPPKLFQA